MLIELHLSNNNVQFEQENASNNIGKPFISCRVIETILSRFFRCS